MSAESASISLVTGASGFLGEHLCRYLLEHGESVVATGSSRRPAAGHVIEQCDLIDPHSVHALVERVGPRVVYHCAALANAGRCEEHPKIARAVNIEGTRNLLSALRHHDPRARLVFVSTDLVFDGAKAPFREADPPNPLSVYGRSKTEAEQLVLDGECGTVVRASLLYGARTTYSKSFLSWMIDKLEREEPLDLFVDEWRTPLFVEDLCMVMRDLATRGAKGIWHAGGPERLDRVSMGRIVCEVSGLSAASIRPTRRADANSPAPRPADVSLDSSRMWSFIEKVPTPFAEGVRRALRKPAGA